ncbi:hypothetical protein [Seleniivibrio woodruffii]|uniref:hypothetical protein n=1 Tax=Seleniivibrio woodruffii TaxID=1078050 RepID=UPI0026E9855E|nr:hypothetical protein [Seleniivibrio woodruffii]
MIISGKYYPTQDLTNKAETSSSSKTSDVDSLTALKTFFGESEESKPTGFADTVDISAKALSVLEDYVQSSGSNESDSLLSYIKGTAREKFLGTYDKSAMEELSGAMQSYNNKELQEVYEKVKEANQQMSGDFISVASRYGVQSLL